LLIEILKHTPLWVFALFFVLLAYGYSQSKNRVVSSYRIAILPSIMISLSFYGVLSAFGLTLNGFVLWGVGVAISTWVGKFLVMPQGVIYPNETQSFSIVGSWLPLILMLTIFFIKYAVGVILARQLPIGNAPIFIATVSFLYGFFSGLFLSRALMVWRSRKRLIETMSNPPLNPTRADNARAG
jgi:hypothetical protein